jgi:hypothetical protein
MTTFVRCILIAGLFAGTCLAGDLESSTAYWGLEGGGGRLWLVPSIAKAVEDEYELQVSGNTYQAGLVRFHPNGAPNFSLSFMRFDASGTAIEKRSNPSRYSGNAAVSGVMATKHVSVFARERGGFGFSFGGGIGPQFKASYKGVSGSGIAVEKTYTLKEVPVTPMFEVLVRADIRVHRYVSVAPFVGLRNGFMAGGGMVRFHVGHKNSRAERRSVPVSKDKP